MILSNALLQQRNFGSKIVFQFSGICMSIGILCFPAGWDNDHVRGICGASAADYVLGDCGIR